MRKQTARKHVESQLPANYYHDDAYKIDPGEFAESTIRKAINYFELRCEIDQVDGTILAVVTW